MNKQANIFFKGLIVLILCLVSNPTSAVIVEGEVDSQEELSAFINHHVVDDHEWHFYGEGESAIHLPLPIILIDGGLKVFSSDAFSVEKVINVPQDGPTTVKYTADGNYAIFHGKIYKTSQSELIFDHVDLNKVSVKTETTPKESEFTKDATYEFEGKEFHYQTTEDGQFIMFHHNIYESGAGFTLSNHPSNVHPLDFSITKNVAVLFLSVILILLIFGSVAKAYQKRGVDSAPSGLQGFMEPLILFVRDEIARPNIGEKRYMSYMPFLLTIFFLIWIINLLGLIPFLGGVNLSGNISFTLVMALITYIVTSFSGKKDYWKHIFMPPVPIPLYIIMIPVEIIGTLTKPFALMIRLFANITAGHIVILAFMGIIFVNKSVGWAGLSVPMGLFISVLELLVAFLQAFIFTMLTALFIGSAVEEHEHH